MAKSKACKKCRLIHDKDVCPNCGHEESTTTHYGKVTILNTTDSELAKNLKYEKKGEYAVKLG